MAGDEASKRAEQAFWSELQEECDKKRKKYIEEVYAITSKAEAEGRSMVLALKEAREMGKLVSPWEMTLQ